MKFDVSKTQTLAFSAKMLSEGSLFGGRYLVIGELGKGGMGHVYRVLDTKIDEEVALKFINAEIAADRKIIERFRNELKITRKITHRHVCRMYDLSEDDKSLFITMEYIPGEDLSNMIQRLGKLPVEKGFCIAQQVCEGLAEVHRLGVVHRDLKPKNIMIDKEGNAKIMDFGLARTPHGVKLTEIGQVVGTPTFMSPEQLNGETVDQRADIFSLGIIMFAMLTGRLPFEADSTLTLALLHKTHRPPNPIALNPRIPGEIGRIIMKCLEVDKAKRYQTTQDLLADFRKASEMFDTYQIHVPGRKRGPIRSLVGGLPWSKILTVTSLLLGLAASGLAVRAFLKKSRLNAERKQVIQEISRLAAEKNFSSAYRLAQQAEQASPADPRLASLWPQISSTLSVDTIPSGATVFLKDERVNGLDLQAVGQTPLDKVRVPISQIRIKIEKQGFDTVEETTSDVGGSLHFLLAKVDDGAAASKQPMVNEIARNGTRTAYKISAGIDGAVGKGHTGSVFYWKSDGSGKTEHVVARFSVRESFRDRSLIETLDQKEDIQLGYLIKFDEKVTAVPVTIVTEPSRASIVIDGIQMGISNSTFNLAPGKHALKIIKTDYQDYEESFVVDADSKGRNRKEYWLTPRLPDMGTLVITSDPPEADIYLADSAIPAGRTPFTKDLVAGKITVRISKPNYHEQADEIDLKPGTRTPVNYQLTPEDGSVEISSVPEGADVYFGDKFAGTTPFRQSLKPATYQIKVIMKGLGEQEDTITVLPGESLPRKLYVLNKSRPAPARYVLKVSSEPQDALVSINGIPNKQKTPFTVECSTAEVRLKIEKEEFRSQEEVRVLKPTPYRNDWNPTLERLGNGQLTITSSDTAQVFLDGKLLGTFPPQIIRSVSEGPHTVTWVLEDVVIWKQDVSVRPQESLKVHFNKEDHREIFETGRYELSASPNAELEVDQKSQGIIPPQKSIRSTEGPHNIKYTFRDMLGKALIAVEIDDILGKKGLKRIHLTSETEELKGLKDPDFPPGYLDPQNDEGLVIRPLQGTALNKLKIHVDGQPQSVPLSGEIFKLRVPARGPHALKFGIMNSGENHSLEIKVYRPNARDLIIIKLDMTVI